MSNKPQAPTAKRSPSILVTDARSNNFRPAPFASRPVSGRSKFSKVSLDDILANVSDIPSGRQRPAPAAAALRQRGTTGRTGGAGGGLPGQRGKAPPILNQNIPSRTTKLSQKLVLIPDEIEPGHRFIDEGVDVEAPPTPWAHREHPEDEAAEYPHRSFAERLPKDRRTDKFPRVTAYCISDGIRLQACMQFLMDNHKIRPRIYDEALFAPYYLPLLSGDGEGSRVKSSPGGIQMLEQLIDISEGGDHHYEYFSGLEEQKDMAHKTDDEFDPSEPQDFTPPASSYMPSAAPGEHGNEHGDLDHHDHHPGHLGAQSGDIAAETTAEHPSEHVHSADPHSEELTRGHAHRAQSRSHPPPPHAQAAAPRRAAELTPMT